MTNKWLKRKRNSLGFGVQSPGDFYFVQHVLREQSPYYGYTTLRAIEKEYNSRIPFYSEATNRLLFRLANHVHPDTIIEVGTGLSLLAMAMACPSVRCVAVTPSDTYHATISPLLSGYPNVEVGNGDEKALFGNLLHESGNGTLLLHVAHTPHYREIVDAALPCMNGSSLMVIEEIRADKEKRDWWKSLQADRLTGISYDLGSIGLLFFDRTRYKDTYWINLKD